MQSPLLQDIFFSCHTLGLCHARGLFLAPRSSDQHVSGPLEDTQEEHTILKNLPAASRVQTKEHPVVSDGANPRTPCSRETARPQTGTGTAPAP